MYLVVGEVQEGSKVHNFQVLVEEAVVGSKSHQVVAVGLVVVSKFPQGRMHPEAVAVMLSVVAVFLLHNLVLVAWHSLE